LFLSGRRIAFADWKSREMRFLQCGRPRCYRRSCRCEREWANEKCLTVPHCGATPAGSPRQPVRGRPKLRDGQPRIEWREGEEKVDLLAGGPVRRHRQATTVGGLSLTTPISGPPSWPAGLLLGPAGHTHGEHGQAQPGHERDSLGAHERLPRPDNPTGVAPNP
jgi:hypothetical protein